MVVVISDNILMELFAKIV
jgi:hypothetical protein